MSFCLFVYTSYKGVIMGLTFIWFMKNFLSPLSFLKKFNFFHFLFNFEVNLTQRITNHDWVFNSFYKLHILLLLHLNMVKTAEWLNYCNKKIILWRFNSLLVIFLIPLSFFARAFNFIMFLMDFVPKGLTLWDILSIFQIQI